MAHVIGILGMQSGYLVEFPFPPSRNRLVIWENTSVELDLSLFGTMIISKKLKNHSWQFVVSHVSGDEGSCNTGESKGIDPTEKKGKHKVRAELCAHFC